MDDTALDFDSIDINHDSCIAQLKQTCKRKNRSNSHYHERRQTLPAFREVSLEEASALDDLKLHQAKQRSSTRANLDEESKRNDEDDDNDTLQVF